MQCLDYYRARDRQLHQTILHVFKQRFNVCCGNEVPVLSIAVAPLKRLQNKLMVVNTL
jgi:hypothetical protein